MNYFSSAMFRVLVAGMQAMGCFVYSWPATSRPGPNPVLCAWAAAVKLSLFAWLGLEIYYEVSHHNFLCIGEIAHVLAVLLNLTALAFLPALLTVRSKQMSKVLSDLGDIPRSHGPTYMSKMSQFSHVLVILVAFTLITWSYVVTDALDAHWKPLFAVLSMFVIMRVFIISLFFRVIFHSLAGEIRYETQQLADRPAPPQHDPDSPSDRNSNDHTPDDHKHKDGGCQRVCEYLGNSKTNLEVDVKSPSDEVIEHGAADDTWKETQHLDVGHLDVDHPPAGAREDDLLFGLTHLEQKIYMVSECRCKRRREK